MPPTAPAAANRCRRYLPKNIRRNCPLPSAPASSWKAAKRIRSTVSQIKIAPEPLQGQVVSRKKLDRSLQFGHPALYIFFLIEALYGHPISRTRVIGHVLVKCDGGSGRLQ